MGVYTYCRTCGTGFTASTEDIRRGRWRLCPRCYHDGEAAEDGPSDPGQPEAVADPEGSSLGPPPAPARTSVP
jgi:hypothetical protein